MSTLLSSYLDKFFPLLPLHPHKFFLKTGHAGFHHGKFAYAALVPRRQFPSLYIRASSYPSRFGGLVSSWGILSSWILGPLHLQPSSLIHGNSYHSNNFKTTCVGNYYLLNERNENLNKKCFQGIFRYWLLKKNYLLHICEFSHS